VLLTVVDEAMGSIPDRDSRPRVTASLNVRFRRPVRIMRTVRARARVVDRHAGEYLVRATLGYEDDDERLVAEGRFVILDAT
jgi:acyl-coenzyme A thioesterase PaaI-like protein